MNKWLDSRKSLLFTSARKFLAEMLDQMEWAPRTWLARRAHFGKKGLEFGEDKATHRVEARLYDQWSFFQSLLCRSNVMVTDKHGRDIWSYNLYYLIWFESQMNCGKFSQYNTDLTLVHFFTIMSRSIAREFLIYHLSFLCFARMFGKNIGGFKCYSQ